MGTIVDRDGRFLVRIRRRGVGDLCHTFGTREAAEEWKVRTDCLIDYYLATSRRGIKTDLNILLTEIEGVAASLLEKRRTPIVGIYFLLNGDECVYVGQSLDVPRRIADHRLNGIEFDRHEAFQCEADRLDELERFYVRSMKPRLNVALM